MGKTEANHSYKPVLSVNTPHPHADPQMSISNTSPSDAGAGVGWAFPTSQQNPTYAPFSRRAPHRTDCCSLPARADFPTSLARSQSAVKVSSAI